MAIEETSEGVAELYAHMIDGINTGRCSAQGTGAVAFQVAAQVLILAGFKADADPLTSRAEFMRLAGVAFDGVLADLRNLRTNG